MDYQGQELPEEQSTQRRGVSCDEKKKEKEGTLNGSHKGHSPNW